jgi:hypothetical protein
MDERELENLPSLVRLLMLMSWPSGLWSMFLS